MAMDSVELATSNHLVGLAKGKVKLEGKEHGHGHGQGGGLCPAGNPVSVPASPPVLQNGALPWLRRVTQGRCRLPSSQA